MQSLGHPARDDRGISLSAFFAVVVVSLLLVAGLVVDGGAKVAGDRRAEAVAALAARAGADAGAAAEVAGGDRSSAAQTAARDLLAAHGMAGEVSVNGDRVRVTTHVEVPVTFLSLIGVDTLHASGEADASVLAR